MARSSSARSLRTAKYAFGYNAQTHEYGDLYEQGVIDPTKVVRARCRTLLRLLAF